MPKILRCNKCKIYTLKTTCPICKSKTISTITKYSPKNNYSKYRLINKKRLKLI